jgi:hypothetical protein
MGTWDTGIFDNDTACDWAQTLVERDDLALVDAALDGAIETRNACLDADQGAEALAAAEVVARLQGRWGERNVYTERMDAWIERQTVAPASALVQKAVQAVDRVLQSPSELRELWEDAGSDFEAWQAVLVDLRCRIRP